MLLPLYTRLNKEMSTFHLLSAMGCHEIGLLSFDPAAEKPLVKCVKAENLNIAAC